MRRAFDPRPLIMALGALGFLLAAAGALLERPAPAPVAAFCPLGGSFVPCGDPRIEWQDDV